MNEHVKAYIEAQQAAEREEYEKKKRKTLEELELYEKEYSDEGYTAEYCFSEYDTESQTYKYYKRTPIEISDEEYEEIKKFCKTKNERKRNPISVMLIVIAVCVYVGGFIGSILLMDMYDEAGLIVGWLATFVSGTLYLSLAEILQLLHEIRNK